MMIQKNKSLDGSLSDAPQEPEKTFYKFVIYKLDAQGVYQLKSFVRVSDKNLSKEVFQVHKTSCFAYDCFEKGLLQSIKNYLRSSSVFVYNGYPDDLEDSVYDSDEIRTRLSDDEMTRIRAYFKLELDSSQVEFFEGGSD